MTAHQAGSASSAHLVNDRVQVLDRGRCSNGRISAIHRHEDGIEYVVRLDADDGGMGTVVNVRTSDSRSALLATAGDAVEAGRSA